MTDKHIYCSRRGSTLVELCIVMALFSILSVMIVSFSAMADTFADDQQKKYAFFESASQIQQDITDVLMSCDSIGAEVIVYDTAIVCDHTTAAFDAVSKTFNISHCDGTETSKKMGRVTLLGFELSPDGGLLKCTVYGEDSKGRAYSDTFVFTLHCAEFSREGGYV